MGNQNQTPPAPAPVSKQSFWQQKTSTLKTRLAPFIEKFKQTYQSLPSNSQKLIKYSGLGLGILIGLVIILGLIVKISSRPQKSFEIPQASPPTTQSQANGTPSRYATDSAVLEAEKELETLQREIDAGFDDPRLLPPELNFEIEF